MANIVLGIGASHGPMLSTPPAQWDLRAGADRDTRQRRFRMSNLTADAPRRAAQAEQHRGLAFGLPNHWYPVLRSAELGTKPVRIRRFGEELIVWRGASGGVSIMHDACPHRGAPLSRGRVEGDEILCAYHGWRFDPQGACKSMPLEPTPNPRLARVAIRAWRAAERAGYVWMFYGDPARATPLAVPAELEDPDRLHFKTEYYWRTNWINVLDNVLDPLHAIHLHVGATTQKNRAKFKHFEITRDDATGFRLGKVGYRPDGSVGTVEGEVEFLLPNVTRLDIADGTAEGIYRVVILATPIDEEVVFHDPSCVKVVRATDGRALYFSRSPVPYHRDGRDSGPLGLLHLGIYAYRRAFLLGLARLAPSPLEGTEKLEQLRVLEAGHAIAVGVVLERGIGIDTPEDYRRFAQRWRQARGAVA